MNDKLVLNEHLAEDFTWFVSNYYELYNEYGHCWLVIANQYVLSTFPSFKSAVSWVTKNKLLGTVLIQEIDGTEEAYTAYVYQLMEVTPRGM